MSAIRTMRSRGTLFGAALLLCAMGAMRARSAWNHWNEKRPLEPRGGLYFPVKILTAPPCFAQADPRWGVDRLGPTEASFAAEGCAVSSAAMALAFYGFNIDPGQLNTFLNNNHGYTPQGWIYWEAAAEFEPGKVRHAYEDLPSYRLIDSNLARHNPVIVRIRRPGGGKHFVLIVGKQGYEYIAQDPGAGGRQVLLSALESPVEALRFYERL